MTYSGVFESDVLSRIDAIVDGVQATEAKRLLDIPGLARGDVLLALDLPVATFNKKVRSGSRLSTSEGERVLGFARLVGQVEAMVQDAGEAEGFDAREWLAHWLVEPLPALGGVRPIDMMRTMEGQALVSNKLAQMVSGAYA